MMEFSDDIIDDILNNGVHKYSCEHKLKLKEKRPTPILNLNMVDGKSIRKFQFMWYTKYVWLSGSQKRNKLFCYYCLLFQGEKEWSEEGITTIKNFERKASKHANSKKHLICLEKFKLFGQSQIDHALSEGRHLAALKYNELVGINRRKLSRFIQVVCNLGKQEFAFQGHNEIATLINEDNYLELLDVLSREEHLLKEYFSVNSNFEETSSNLQNDLISCITEVVNIRIMNELNNAKFVSVQVDETTDVSCKSQISIVFRYIVDDIIEERFVGFFDVSKEKTALEISEILLREIKKWNINKKIICQTFDGAVLMDRKQNSVQTIIKETYPNAILVHCHAHQLNLVLLHGSKTIKSVRLFISDLTMFYTFFSGSSKRSELLRERGFKLPKSCKTKWNFLAKAPATIINHFTELQKAVLCVTEEEEWDPTSVSLAYGLLHTFSNFKFVYLLCLFHKIFIISDQVFLTLQTKCTFDILTCIIETTQMLTELTAMRNKEIIVSCCKFVKILNNELKHTAEDVNSLKHLTYEILDSIITQCKLRFQDFILLSFVEITNKSLFKDYKNNYPIKKIQQLENNFPGVFDLERLKNELTIIFNDNNKYLSPKELLNYIIKADLKDVYQEVTKLLQLILCIPITASSESNISVLKRIKTFLRYTMKDDRLTNLSTLVIEKKMLGELIIDPTFMDKVIDIFSKNKNKSIDLIYKIV